MSSFLSCDNAAEAETFHLNSELEMRAKRRRSVLDLSQIESIEKTLSFADKVSLLFLLHEEPALALDAIGRLSSALPLTHWCKSASSPSWQIQLLQSIALIKHFKSLEALGVSKFDRGSLFLCPEAPWFRVRRRLHALCEQLIKAETDSLIAHMEDGMPPSPQLTQRGFKDNLLEGFILRWALSSKLNLTEPVSLSKLTECLRSIKREDCADEIDALLEGGGTLTSLPPSFKSCSVVSDDCYPIVDASNVGLFVLFDEREFDNEGDPRCPSFDSREGSEKDAESLCKVMESLNLKVCLEENVKCGDICPTLKRLLLDHFVPSRHSVLIVGVLSHGLAGGVYGSDCRLLPIQKMVDVFGEPALSFLKPVPKVIIIQACQGDKYYEYVESDGVPLSPPSVNLHLANLLFCSSTVYGFRSFRSRTSGTWYIQVLCEELKKNPCDDFLSIVTKVNHRISKMYAPTIIGLKLSMLPHFDSTLTKKLYLSF